MPQVYPVPWAPQPEERLLCEAPRALLAHWYPVPGSSYRPASYGQLLRTPFALYVRLVCEEPAPYAVQRLPNSPVCTDSCLEFFLEPEPGTGRFLNFELNARGTMLLGLNAGGVFRCLDPALQAGCFPQAVTDPARGRWEVRFCVPDTLLQTVFPACIPAQAARMRGNFYKCGDAAPQPHYGSWNPVTRRPIDFHCPECFGDLLFVNQ